MVNQRVVESVALRQVFKLSSSCPHCHVGKTTNKTKNMSFLPLCDLHSVTVVALALAECLDLLD